MFDFQRVTEWLCSQCGYQKVPLLLTDNKFPSGKAEHKNSRVVKSESNPKAKSGPKRCKKVKYKNYEVFTKKNTCTKSKIFVFFC